MPSTSRCICLCVAAAGSLLASSCKKEALPAVIRQVVSADPPTTIQMMNYWCEQSVQAKDAKSASPGTYFRLGPKSEFTDVSKPAEERGTWELVGDVLKISSRGEFVIEKYEPGENGKTVLVLSQANGQRTFDRDCKDEEEFYSRPSRFIDAASAGHLDTVSKLLAAGGFDVNVRQRGSKTALILAASYNHADVVHFLLEHGANPALTDKKGKTALDFAKLMHRRLLIPQLEAAERGEPLPEVPIGVHAQAAEPGSGDPVANYGTPIAITAQALRGAWHSPDLVDSVLLLGEQTFERRLNEMPNEASVISGQWTLNGSTLELAGQTETNIRNTSRSSKDNTRMVPFRISLLTATTLKLVVEGDLEMVHTRIDPAAAKAAIDADAVPANSADKLGEAMKDPGFQQLTGGQDAKALQHTAFCNAAALGDLPGVRSFLEQGVEIDKLDTRAPEPRTALIMATKFQQVEVVKLLLDHGASKQPRDASGKSALDYAHELHHDELIALLR